MSAKKTTSALRQQLSQMLDDVITGKADLHAVAEANKTAGRINESLFAEATMMGRQQQLGQTIAKLGELEL